MPLELFLGKMKKSPPLGWWSNIHAVRIMRDVSHGGNKMQSLLSFCAVRGAVSAEAKKNFLRLRCSPLIKGNAPTGSA